MNRILLILSLITLLPKSYSQEFKPFTNHSEFINLYKAKSKVVKSISANFEESIYSSMLLEPTKNEGQFNYEAKNKIRLEKLESPYEVILFDGIKLKRYKNNELLENQASNKVTKKIIDLMLVLIDGRFLESSNFKVMYYENENNYKLILSPQKSVMAKSLKSIELLFSKSNLSLQEFTIFESELDFINYRFYNLEYNKQISSTKFHSL